MRSNKNGSPSSHHGRAGYGWKFKSSVLYFSNNKEWIAENENEYIDKAIKLSTLGVRKKNAQRLSLRVKQSNLEMHTFG